jgi:hypothetical protein
MTNKYLELFYVETLVGFVAFCFCRFLKVGGSHIYASIKASYGMLISSQRNLRSNFCRFCGLTIVMLATATSLLVAWADSEFCPSH